MEPLSGVASGMAVVSLSLQLIQSVGTVNSFIRSVENAPKELVRLTGLLERLGAILKDVHHFLEKQDNVPGHLKATSATIACCLHSCEESLLPLHDIVEKNMRLQARNQSTTARLRAGIGLGVRAKDIADLERRIHHEISNLTNAVVIVSAISQTTAILHVHDISKKTNKPLAQQIAVTKRNGNGNGNGTFHSFSLSWRVKQNEVHVPSAWRFMGLSKQHWSRYLRGSPDIDQTDDVALSEAYEYLWSIPRLGRVVQVCCYGYLTGSLVVFPVVHDFDKIIKDLFVNGSLDDFQQHLSSGALHPFARNRHSVSLMHMAAQYVRLDCCRVLTAHGLRPDLSYNGRGLSPFWYSMCVRRTSNRVSVDVVDFLRYFLLDSDLIDDFEGPNWSWFTLGHELDVIKWLWRYSVTVLTDTEKLHFQRKLLQNLVSSFVYNGRLRILRTQLDTVVAYLDTRLLDQAMAGKAELLLHLVGTYEKVADSHLAGDAFIEFLRGLGVDPVATIGNELDLMDRHIVKGYWCDRPKKNVTFVCQGRDSYGLCWEYVFDDVNPSTPFLKEFTALTADALTEESQQWPFSPIDHSLPTEDRFRVGSKWESRHHRRMATKACKEAARLGHQRPRSSMPGAWIS